MPDLYAHACITRDTWISCGQVLSHADLGLALIYRSCNTLQLLFLSTTVVICDGVGLLERFGGVILRLLEAS